MSDEEKTSASGSEAQEGPQEGAEERSHLRQKVAATIAEATMDGMFPLLAYGLDPARRHSEVYLVTSTIPDMVLAQEMLRRFVREDYNLGKYLPWDRLAAFTESHPTIVLDFPWFSRHLLGYTGT